MNQELSEGRLVLAGKPLEGAWDRIRRYCGLAWSGGPPETWAFPYYDLVDTDPRQVTPVDVLATASLHPGLSRSELEYFHTMADALNQWLDGLPTGVPLDDADDAVLGRLDEVATWTSAPALTLLSKVLHRKRPALIPLVDRHVLDRYRPITGERSAVRAWSPLLRELGADLRANRSVLDAMSGCLNAELGVRVSPLRLVDIGIWMEARR